MAKKKGKSHDATNDEEENGNVTDPFVGAMQTFLRSINLQPPFVDVARSLADSLTDDDRDLLMQLSLAAFTSLVNRDLTLNDSLFNVAGFKPVAGQGTREKPGVS